jgi:hypothetical protein
MEKRKGQDSAETQQLEEILDEIRRKRKSKRNRTRNMKERDKRKGR